MVQWIAYEIEGPEAVGVGIAALTILYIVWCFFTVPGGYRVMTRAERRAEAEWWAAYHQHHRRRGSGGGGPWDGGDGGVDAGGGGGGE